MGEWATHSCPGPRPTKTLWSCSRRLGTCSRRRFYTRVIAVKEWVSCSLSRSTRQRRQSVRPFSSLSLSHFHASMLPWPSANTNTNIRCSLSHYALQPSSRAICTAVDPLACSSTRRGTTSVPALQRVVLRKIKIKLTDPTH